MGKKGDPKVEADPFYGRENDDAIRHLTKLTELGSLFTTDERIRNFYVTKLLPFSLKGDVREWYDALPSGSIQSPQDMAIYLVDKYFPTHMQHAALQKIITLNSCRMSTSLNLGGGIAV